MFCDDCGSMKHSRDGEMVCSSCGARRSKDADRRDLVTTETQSDDDVIESSPDADFEGKPTADDVTCDDCGHGEAWYTIKQTGAADEPPTRFFNCEDGKSLIKLYSKSSTPISV